MRAYPFAFPLFAALAATYCPSSASAAEPPQPAPRVYAVHFEADPPGLQLYRRPTLSDRWTFRRTRQYRWGAAADEPYRVSGSASDETLCVAPCDTTLPPGSYELALSRVGGDAVAVEYPVFITGPTTLNTSFVDRSGYRRAGGLVLGGGLLGGLALLYMSIHTSNVCSSGRCQEVSGMDWTTAGLGVGAIAVGTIVGLALLTRKDEAKITLVPTGPVATLGRHERALDGSGLAVRVRF